jgi:PPM family protein phosphatase
LQLESASLTDNGGRPRNEDAFGEWASERLYYCAIADGAGGHGGGDVAARIVVDTSLADLRFLTVDELPPDGERLKRALLHAHENIMEEQARGGEVADMRSTGLLLAIDRDRRTAAWAHCGDTRLYYFRGGVLDARTKDHSVVQEMMDAHLVSAEDARHHPRRNILLSALGTREGAEIASTGGTREVLAHDVLLLCTDGLWGYVDDASMIDSLAHASSSADWLNRMATQVRDTAPPGNDNFTALAIWVGGL